MTENALVETEQAEIPVHEIQPSQIDNVVLYQMLQFSQTPNGEIQTGIIQVPVPRDLIETFQAQFGADMATENLKLVIVKGKAFLAPAKTSSLIGFRDA